MRMRNHPGNLLCYGDNLAILRDHIADVSVDLVYLDPPFNSNANYNILFKSPKGIAADGQIEAFEDSWHYGEEAARAFHEVMTRGNSDTANLLRAMQDFLGQNDMMAYLAMMAVRLIELHRVLKPTGSLYLHCDPTASHYLKLLLDGVFGARNYRNEIIWKRQSAHSDARTKFPDVADTILFYAKSDKAVFQPRYAAHDPDYVAKFYRFDDADGRGAYRLGDTASPNPRPNLMYEWRGYPHPQKGWRYQQETMQRLHDEGRLHYPRMPDGAPDYSKRIALKRYLSEQQGSIVTSIWTDIHPLHAQAQERLGYPTQKPLALLERIIAASSNPGDVVLDPFCGCGTAVHAAQKLGRPWIGIDVTYLAVGLIERRLREAFPGIGFEIVGEPKGRDDAAHLAATEPHQFQYWIVQKIGGQPWRGGRKGADRGIDGYIYYTRNEAHAGKSSTAAAIVSVKAGRNIGVAMVRELKGVLEREKADIGIFACAATPTREMAREAAAAGVWTDPATGTAYPRVQLFTLADLFEGRRPRVPLLDAQAGFRQAKREAGGSQQRLL